MKELRAFADAVPHLVEKEKWRDLEKLFAYYEKPDRPKGDPLLLLPPSEARVLKTAQEWVAAAMCRASSMLVTTWFSSRFLPSSGLLPNFAQKRRFSSSFALHGKVRRTTCLLWRRTSLVPGLAQSGNLRNPLDSPGFSSLSRTTGDAGTGHHGRKPPTRGSFSLTS